MTSPSQQALPHSRMAVILCEAGPSAATLIRDGGSRTRSPPHQPPNERARAPAYRLRWLRWRLRRGFAGCLREVGRECKTAFSIRGRGRKHVPQIFPASVCATGGGDLSGHYTFEESDPKVWPLKSAAGMGPPDQPLRCSLTGERSRPGPPMHAADRRGPTV